eukprot:6752157-Pyramimonas_sp.AAC.1
MSKKIAQLTKVITGDVHTAVLSRLTPHCVRHRVIYHLNNKNEDHDFDLQEQSDQYESEIEQ